MRGAGHNPGHVNNIRGINTMKRESNNYMGGYNTVYPTRYHAKKAMRGDKVIVKVSSMEFTHLGQDWAYVLMDYADYHIWRKQL